jgi:hypothetical protein
VALRHRPDRPRRCRPRLDPDRSHPRGQLPGAHFILRYPAHGWNGALVNHQAPNDGGFFYPAAPLNQLPADAIALLDRGYALWTVALGGTVFAHDGLVDTNPDSGSGIFWGGDLVSYLRPALIAADGTESAVPEPSQRSAPFLDFVFDVDLGDPFYGLDQQVQLQTSPELVRDGIVVGKRLVQRLTGSTQPVWTVFLAWSGSGGTADALASGRINGLVNMDGGQVPYNGGNFNSFRDPTSGKRYDAFLLMAGASNTYVFRAPAEEQDGAIDELYPATAPMIWIGGDADILSLSLTGYVYANRIARALPGSAQAGTPIADLIAIYNVHGMTHLPSEFLFANVGRRHDLRYAVADGFNRLGSGRLVQPVAVEQSAFDEFALSEDDFYGLIGLPRTAPLFLQAIANLRALTTSGAPLPTSRVETALFTHLDDLTAESIYPLYPPAPCPTVDFTTDVDYHQALVDCTAAIVENGELGLFFGDGGLPGPIEPHWLAAARWFAARNPLPRIVGSIEVPDMAAALGPRLFSGHYAIEQRRSDAELRAGYTAPDGTVYQFANHADYVQTFSAATRDLVAAGLWEPRMGAAYDADAARSGVLTGR